MSLITEARTYGRHRLTPDLPQLALAAAKAVIDGDVGPEDAGKVYLAYFDAKIKRSSAQSLASHKVQVSKLRRIMLLAQEHPKHAVKLLQGVMGLHNSSSSNTALPLYVAMVAVARAQLRSTKLLTLKEIRRLLAP